MVMAICDVSCWWSTPTGSYCDTLKPHNRTGVKSKLIKSESRKGYYVFDYTIQPDRQPERHLVVRAWVGFVWRGALCSMLYAQAESQADRIWSSPGSAPPLDTVNAVIGSSKSHLTASICNVHTHTTDHLRARARRGARHLHDELPLKPIRGAGARLLQDHQLLQDRQHLNQSLVGSMRG